MPYTGKYTGEFKSKYKVLVTEYPGTMNASVKIVGTTTYSLKNSFSIVADDGDFDYETALAMAKSVVVQFIQVGLSVNDIETNFD